MGRERLYQVLGLIVAIAAMIVGLVNPEVRLFLGLDREPGFSPVTNRTEEKTRSTSERNYMVTKEDGEMEEVRDSETNSQVDFGDTVDTSGEPLLRQMSPIDSQIDSLDLMIVQSRDRNCEWGGWIVDRLICDSVTKYKMVIKVIVRERRYSVNSLPLTIQVRIGNSLIVTSRDVLALWDETNFYYFYENTNCIIVDIFDEVQKIEGDAYAYFEILHNGKVVLQRALEVRSCEKPGDYQ
jgi:hypothetical protein